MKALVTGAAGFIGSTLSARLLELGWDVVGVDAMTDYYAVTAKRANVATLQDDDRFKFVEADLLALDLSKVMDDVTHVFHQAGQPGVRSSWSVGFEEYVERNILVTQRLLESARSVGLERFVYASSSSIYGNSASYPTLESDLPRPLSPYGVTKLAAEHLCGVYGQNFGVPTVSLRYFTVYGPKQRPDMATHRLIECALRGTSFRIFGDGSKVRDFTYVDDIVGANICAAEKDSTPGSVFNVAGGASTTMAQLTQLVEEVSGEPVHIQREPDADGDVERTGGSIEAITAALDWTPRVSLREGITRQVAWHKTLQR